ncbi:MAG: GNAT family N-acetyltransferase [Deltaproteobacteria bacterium]|nr:GNAT family N-acetyltransferase [Deltaproteobacteria bacterium]
MKIAFKKMDEDEFKLFAKDSIKSSAEKLKGIRGVSDDEALQEAERQFCSILPQGKSTPNHCLYSLIDTSSKKKIGHLWYGTSKVGQSLQAYLYDIVIIKECQRKGYGFQALSLMEEEAKKMGVQRINLHVLGQNETAARLYRRLGYQVSVMNLFKKLAR